MDIDKSGHSANGCPSPGSSDVSSMSSNRIDSYNTNMLQLEEVLYLKNLLRQYLAQYLIPSYKRNGRMTYLHTVTKLVLESYYRDNKEKLYWKNFAKK